MKEKLVIIDGSSLLYRAFYAIPTLTDSQGRYTNAVYGFLNMLLKLYEELDPHYVAVAFDKDKHTFRHTLYTDYKATRKPAPEELRPQFALIREVLECLGIHVLEKEGYEGDDILGTVARQSQAAGLEVAVVTGDRDALQLADRAITVYLTKKGITHMQAVTPEVMVREYGYTPAQVIDMKALMGDTADNIPGVPGVGEKTALKLIQEFGGVDGVYARLSEVKGVKLREKLQQYRESAMLSKQLAAICCDVPLTYTKETFLPQPREEEVRALFQQLGFRQLLTRFAAFARFAPCAPAAAVAPVLREAGTDDIPPAALVGARVAVAAVYDEQVPVPQIRDMAVAVDGQVVHLSATHIPAYLERLPQAAQIITVDGKRLYKVLRTGKRPAPFPADVVLGSYLLDPTRTSYALSYLATRFEVPLPEGAAPSVCAEALFAAQVWEKEEAALQQFGLTDLYERIEAPLLYTLSVMETNGFTVDTARLQAMKTALTAQAAALEKEIYEAAGAAFNINSPKQLGHMLFEVLHLPVRKKTKTGYSTDAEVLESLRDTHPAVEKIVRFRALKKLISTYLDGLEPLIVPATGRVYTSFHQTVTATGRLSSSDPNLQNIPIRTEQGKKIRSLFVPGKGYDYILSGDYSQIELRLLAHLSQDPTMIDGFKKNQDIHRRTASEVFHIPWEQVTPEERSHAKAVNFGIIYGISDFGLARNIGISRAQAKQYIESYFARYSTIHGYMEELVRQAKETGITRTMFGRMRTLTDINSKNFTRRSLAERMAMNTPIQGSAADIIKLAMNAVQRELEQRQLRSRLLVQVHDELVLEVPADELELVKTLLKRTMEEAVTLSVPLIADLHYGKNWEEAK